MPGDEIDCLTFQFNFILFWFRLTRHSVTKGNRLLGNKLCYHLVTRHSVALALSRTISEQFEQGLSVCLFVCLPFVCHYKSWSLKINSMLFCLLFFLIPNSMSLQMQFHFYLFQHIALGSMRKWETDTKVWPRLTISIYLHWPTLYILKATNTARIQILEK